MYKTLILDLDGTLLSSDKTISEKNKQAVKSCIKAGTNVSIASGRPPTSVYPYVEELGLEDFYHIADNGASIFKYGGEVINDYKFNSLSYKALIKTLRDGNIDYAVLSPLSNDYIHEGAEVFENIMNTYSKTKATKVSKEEIDSIPNAYKISAIYKSEDDYDKISKLQENYDIDVFIVGHKFLDIMPRGINKFTGAKAIEKHTGISTDDMIAMGDYENDIDILSNIGFGICMNNGLEKVKKVADIVLEKNNDQDAVAYVIDKYILGGK